MAKLNLTVILLLTFACLATSKRVLLELPSNIEDVILGQQRSLPIEEFYQRTSELFQQMEMNGKLSRKDVKMAQNFTEEYVKKNLPNSAFISSADIVKFTEKYDQGFEKFFENQKDRMVIATVSLLGMDSSVASVTEYLRDPESYGLTFDSFNLLSSMQ